MLRTAVLAVALGLSLLCCTRQDFGQITHRDRQGHPDQWLYRTGSDQYKILLDSNRDERPDIIKTYRNGILIEVESDRNFNGKVDLMQEYSQGILAREVHDDDFDGHPESIRIFRQGKLAMVELDPHERGYADIVEFYNDSGQMIRRETRNSGPALGWNP